MSTPDESLDALRQIEEEFGAFCQKEGPASETDTRVKLIDRILREVLGWPESELVREPYVPGRGFMDYTLKVRGRRFVTVEAKREGIPFILPSHGKHRYLKLSGALSTDPEIKAAINQVRQYCDDESIRYAIATNGYSWILFRALREDMRWRDGQAIVFASLKDIAEDFTFFWNLLSYEQLQSGGLDSEFGAQLRIERKLNRVVDILWNVDQPLQRNRLHIKLLPLISAVFEDIADQAQIEILQSCYIHSNSLQIVARELGVVITDEIPHFLLNEGAIPIRQNAEDAGAFGDLLEREIPTDKGHLCLLLGGIGSGKTTFLKRYQRTVGKELLDTKTLWFSVDFLRAPLDPQELEDYVWRTVLKQLRERYGSENLEVRHTLKVLYKVEIKALEETVLRHAKRHTDECERILSPFLERWQSDISNYVPRLLAAAKPHRGIKVVLFIDNVDQLAPSYQAQIFLLGQRVTSKIGSISIIALREESYYTASIQKTFTAYTNHKFHVASPRFLKMIRSRIDYSRDLLARTGVQMDFLSTEEDSSYRNDISDFLKIVEDGVLEQSRVIVHFIEALCFGNMRMALQMLTTFMSSGAAEVDKMLRIYRRDGRYQIAYHEFVKAIMLGDRKYYRESTSPILNVFDCGIEKNSSHFTALRLLNLLVEYRGQSTSEGRGYFEIGRCIALFEDVFDNREDVLRILTRLVNRQLVEVNTRSTESISDASHARATSSGWYYLSRLVGSFVYLDLVLQDTPLNSEGLAKDLRDSVYKVDNLSDPEEDKVQRINARFVRTQRFIDYLRDEEDADFKSYHLQATGGILGTRFVPGIQESFDKQRDRIGRRISENREKYLEDTFLRLSDADMAQLESLLDENTTFDE